MPAACFVWFILNLCTYTQIFAHGSAAAKCTQPWNALQNVAVLFSSAGMCVCTSVRVYAKWNKDDIHNCTHKNLSIWHIYYKRMHVYWYACMNWNTYITIGNMWHKLLRLCVDTSECGPWTTECGRSKENIMYLMCVLYVHIVYLWYLCAILVMWNLFVSFRFFSMK